MNSEEKKKELSDEDKEQLKEMGDQYFVKESELEILEKKVKNLKKEQKERYTKLLKFMGINELEEIELDTGKIKYEKYQKKQGISNKLLIDLLKGFHENDEEKAMSCYSYITNRPKETKERLKIKKFMSN